MHLLDGVGDPYDGVLVDAGALAVDREQFSERLQQSLEVWGRRQRLVGRAVPLLGPPATHSGSQPAARHMSCGGQRRTLTYACYASCAGLVR